MLLYFLQLVKEYLTISDFHLLFVVLKVYSLMFYYIIQSMDFLSVKHGIYMIFVFTIFILFLKRVHFLI